LKFEFEGRWNDMRIDRKTVGRAFRATIGLERLYDKYYDCFS